MLKRTLLLLTALVGLTITSFAYPLTYTKHEGHSFHGGECYVLILRAIRGAEPATDDSGIVGVNVELTKDDAIWHDSVTGCSISSGGEDGFHFTVTDRAGKVVLTAHLEGYSKFVLVPRVKLPITK
jgi:hypothetical protein